MKIAGIDVHKKVLMVVVIEASMPEEKPVRRRFATLPSELQSWRLCVRLWIVRQQPISACSQKTHGTFCDTSQELQPRQVIEKLE